MVLSEERDDFSSESEIQDDDYIQSDGNGEIDENDPALDISDEEAEVCQKITEHISAWN